MICKTIASILYENMQGYLSEKRQGIVMSKNKYLYTLFHQMVRSRAIVFIILKIFFGTYMVLKSGEFSVTH